jgi:hypothetical protein
MVSQYMARIQDEVRARSLYLVQKPAGVAGGGYAGVAELWPADSWGLPANDQHVPSTPTSTS